MIVELLVVADLFAKLLVRYVADVKGLEEVVGPSDQAVCL